MIYAPLEKAPGRGLLIYNTLCVSQRCMPKDVLAEETAQPLAQVSLSSPRVVWGKFYICCCHENILFFCKS